MKFRIYILMSKEAYAHISIVKPTRCTISQFILKQYTLYVSGGLFFHHQEFKTVHIATGICPAGSASRQLLEPAWLIPVAVCTVSKSWWWTERLSKTCRVYCCKINWEIVHLVGFTIEIYHNARSHVCRSICSLNMKITIWFIAFFHCKTVAALKFYKCTQAHSKISQQL